MPPKKKRRSQRIVETVDSETTTKVFPCRFCTKHFQRNEHLQRHERLHTKEKPFQCTACSAAFTRRDLLARHVRVSHPDASVVNDCKSEKPIAYHAESPNDAVYTPNSPKNTPSVQGTRPTRTNSTLGLPSLSHSNTFMMPSTDISVSNVSVPAMNSPTTLSVDPSTDTAQIISEAQPTPNFGDFALFIDSMTMPYTNDPSTLLLDPSLLPLSPCPLFGTLDPPSRTQWGEPSSSTSGASAPSLFDDFSSTFPSFETLPSIQSKQEPWTITQQDWDSLLSEIQSFFPLIPTGFILPSRHTMTRYIATYFSGFHRHLPFLHVPTFSPTKCPVDLVLSMAAIGAQSSFDNEIAVLLFKTSQAIVLERLRCRKAELCQMAFPIAGNVSVEPDDLNELETRQSKPKHFRPLFAAQTLLLLMAIATWGNSRAIYNEAVGLQNTLENLVREEGLLETQTQTHPDMTWCQWVHVEGFKRTIAIIFCFFIFHTIVYDTPPPILNSELDIYLPSPEKDWAARTEKDWQKSRQKADPESQFQSCFSLLFAKPSDESNETSKRYSSLGGYTLILALIQHIYFLRQMSKCKSGPDYSLPSTDVGDVEQALRNWQSGWYLDPESSLSPGSPQGPISFNSTALLRMAYIRLNVDVGPWRALNTHNPHDIARSIHESPPLIPSHKLTRAVLYSAHALSIPVKIGVNIVARNQAFAWSLQHSLCALECAFVLSKWLIAVQDRIPTARPDEDEARLLVYITDMLAEADPGFCLEQDDSIRRHRPDLGVRVIKIWAKLLSGEAVWDVVRMIGKALEAYGHILESERQ